MNFGDISLSQVLYFHFTTRQFSTGTPITAALLAVSVYKDDNTTESTTGITTTFSTGFDGVVGLVSVKIDTSADGTFYAAGHDFSIVVTGGTADGVSIIGEVVGYFSIQNRSALRPRTAGSTLVVDANGLADANTVKLGPTGSGTAQTARDVGAQLDATVSSRMATFSLPTNFSSLAIDASGRVNAFLIGILTSVFTEGALGRIAAAFKQFFNIATPAATMDHLILVDTASTAGAVTTNNDKTGYALIAGYDPAKTAAQAGDAMTLTAGERISVGTAVWASATRSLTTFGTLVADVATAVWSAVTRTLTAASDSSGVTTLLTRIASTITITGGKLDVNDKTGFELTAAYDAAKTASQAGDTMKVSSGTGANQIDLTSGKVNVGKINDASVAGTGVPADLWRGA